MNEYIYLNSYYSEFNDTTKYHRFNLTKPIIGDRNNISLRLSEAEIPVSYYNVITGYNDTFSCKMTVETEVFAEYIVTLPQKNYTVPQLKDVINASLSSQNRSGLFVDFTLRINYDAQTLKFSLTGVNDSGHDNHNITTIEVMPSTTALRLLGVTNSLSTNNTLSQTKILEFPNAVNTNRTKNIYFFTDVFDTENSNNRNDGGSILAKVQANSLFNTIVSYQNESDAFISIPQQNTYIDHINIKLLDDDSEFLDFNRLNFTFSLVVQLTPKKVLKYDDEDRTPTDVLIDMVQQEICED